MGTALAAGLAMALAAPVTGAAAHAAASSAQSSPAIDVRVGGWAENVLPLPGGDVLVSNLGKGLVQRVDGATGEISSVAKVSGPGGMALDGSTLYVVTGNSPASAITREGGVPAIDLTTGATRSVVSGLGEANGLDRLPDGDLVLTVTLGAGAGVQRVDPTTGERRLLTTAVPSPIGLAVGPDGQAYVGSTLLGTISRVDPVTGRGRPLAWGYPGGASIKLRPGGGAVLSTVTGRVVSLDL